MMNRSGVICIFLAFLVGPKVSLALRNGVVCVTDYWNTISCSLNLTVTSSRNTSYRLEIIDNFNKNRYDYQLQTDPEEQVATYTVPSIASFDHYTVTLHYSENGKDNSILLDSSFKPVKNIKPNTPFNLTMQEANGTYHFYWMSGYENHKYLISLPLKYEFLFYKDGVHDNVTINQAVSKATIGPEWKLEPGAVYTAMVRTEIKGNKYNGTWSEWSSPVNWITPEGERNQVGSIFIIMFLILGLIIVILSIGAARMKKIDLVPTPATYFQPLFQNYQGDFKGWVLAKCALQDNYVLEDFATIDKFSEIIATLQDQTEKSEKTQIIYSPAQGHQPYVGPMTELWAPPQMPDTHNEMSVSCEGFPLFCEELLDKVDGLMQSVSVACLSEDVDFLQDSGLSLEDCKLCEEPVIINQMPVCIKQDCCTLTDTSAGPVPTFCRDENTFTS